MDSEMSSWARKRHMWQKPQLSVVQFLAENQGYKIGKIFASKTAQTDPNQAQQPQIMQNILLYAD